ncbi:Hypothetical predicted protein, partial [Paramuricea clavata]
MMFRDRKKDFSETEEIVENLDLGEGPQLGVEDSKDVEDDHEAKVYPQRERKAPQYFGVNNSANVNVDYCYKVCGVLQTYTEAMESPEASGWEKAMKGEMEALKENDTFELTTLPEESLCYLLLNMILLFIRWMSKIAFFHARIDHEMFMEQSMGFEELSEKGVKLVYRLKKSLYGLKQSGRNWNRVLDGYLISDGFVRNPVDHCVYQKQTGGDIVIVVIWVDDLIIASNNTDKISQFKENMKSKFRMKDLEEISYFLGISFKQESGVIKMNQKRYIQKILDRF